MLSIVPSTALKAFSAIPPCYIITIGLSPNFGTIVRSWFVDAFDGLAGWLGYGAGMFGSCASSVAVKSQKLWGSIIRGPIAVEPVVFHVMPCESTIVDAEEGKDRCQIAISYVHAKDMWPIPWSFYGFL